jgi:hypothetical protein
MVGMRVWLAPLAGRGAAMLVLFCGERERERGSGGEENA